MKIKHLPLIVGISLPIVFIVVISVIIFVPSLFINPQYNFIYSTDNNQGYNQQYKNTYLVENNHLSLQPVTIQQNQTYKGDAPTLYLYDVKTNSSHQITLDEAENYSIDPGPSSPDGYTVKYEYNNDGIFGLFGSNNDDSGYFLEKDSGRKHLTALTGGTSYSYYQGDFNLIGWIK